MSRADKRFHQENVQGTAQDTSVRLYAFANTRGGYEVQFSPERPVIVLKTQKKLTASAGTEAGRPTPSQQQQQQQQHPCAQWEPLSSLIFARQPNTTHAVFVADTTALCGTPLDQEELVNGPSVGAVLKRLGNVFDRLNPHDGTLVAAGASAFLAFKYMLVGEKALGHRDRLLRRVVLVSPPSMQTFMTLTEAALRHRRHADGSATSLTEVYRPFEVCVLFLPSTSAETAAQWSRWLQTLQQRDSSLISRSFVQRVTDMSQPCLFAAIATAADIAADGTTVDEAQRHRTPRVYRIDFVLSSQAKAVVQVPRLSPLDTDGCDEPAAAACGHDDEHHTHDAACEESCCRCSGHAHQHHRHVSAPRHTSATKAEEKHEDGGEDDEWGSVSTSEEGGGAESTGESETTYVYGLTALPYCCTPMQIRLEGRVMDVARGVFGTTEGRVHVDQLAELLARAGQTSVSAKTVVALTATLCRDEEGRTTLCARSTRVLSRKEASRAITAGSAVEDIPSYDVSQMAHSYGAVIIRGRKCALVRHAATGETGAVSSSALHLPRAAHCEADESCTECAIRAVCEACDVSSDNFYLPHYLTPVVYYEQADATSDDPPQGQRCVTIFTALAVCPPPAGPCSDAVEDVMDPSEPYEWLSFDKALTLLATDAERETLRDVQRGLARAHAAGLYTPVTGCGLFGEAVADAPKTPREAAPLCALHGLEVVAVVCPMPEQDAGGSQDEAITALLRHAMRVSTVHTYRDDEDEDAAAHDALVAAAEAAGAASAASRVLVVRLGPDVDVELFCAQELLYLTHERAATARVVTLLTPAATRCITDLTQLPTGEAAAAVTERATDEAWVDVLSQLLRGVRCSDALFVLGHEPDSATMALLRCCIVANAELDVYHGIEQRTRIDLTGSATSATATQATGSGAGAALHVVCVALGDARLVTRDVVAQRWTRPRCLQPFYRREESRLLHVKGGVCLGTRHADVSLDIAARCLLVDEEGEDEEEMDKDKARHCDSLTFFIWCKNSVAAEMTALAHTMFGGAAGGTTCE